MAGEGIPGFSDGFMGGLNQGMGIMRQARQDNLAASQAAFERTMQLRQDNRAERGLTIQEDEGKRSATKFGWEETDRPLKQADLQTSVDMHRQELANATTTGKKQELELSFLPGKLRMEAANAAAQLDHTRQETATGYAANARANRAEYRSAEKDYTTLAVQLQPYYTDFISKGQPVPPGMAAIMKHSALGMSFLQEQAGAANYYPSVISKLSKGDQSWRQNPEELNAMATLARPAGMSIARQGGLTPGSARVVDAKMGPGQTVILSVAGFNPKTNRYQTVQQPVNRDQFFNSMHANATAGQLMGSNPSWQGLMDNYGKQTGKQPIPMTGAMAQQFGGQYDQQHAQKRAILYQASQGGKQVPASSIKDAQDWLTAHPDRNEYVASMMGLGHMANEVRGGDANPSDFNRIHVTTAKWTGTADPMFNMDRANKMLALSDKLTGRWDSDPEMKQFAKDHDFTGEKRFDPAARVDFMHRVIADPKMQQKYLQMTHQHRGPNGLGIQPE